MRRYAFNFLLPLVLLPLLRFIGGSWWTTGDYVAAYFVMVVGMFLPLFPQDSDRQSQESQTVEPPDRQNPS